MMDRGLELVALSGYLSGARRQVVARAASFRLDERAAVAVALSDRTGTTMTRAELVTTGARKGPYGLRGSRIALMRSIEASGDPSSPVTSPFASSRSTSTPPAASSPPTTRSERGTGGRRSAIDNDMYSYVISAVDGRILYRQNLTVSDVFNYGSGRRGPARALTSRATTPTATSRPRIRRAFGRIVPAFIPSAIHSLQNYPYSNNDPWLPAGGTETVATT